MIERDPKCKLCKLWQTADEVCDVGFGHPRADILVVSRMPNSQQYQDQIETELTAAGVDIGRCYFTSVVKCRTFDQDPGKGDLKTCTATYLDKQLESMKPKFVLAFGNEALAALSKHSGIMKWRGRVEEITNAGATYQFLATVSPASVNRNPGQLAGFRADLQLFSATVAGTASDMKVPKFNLIDTKEKLLKLRSILYEADLISYDIETAGLDEWDASGGIVSLAGTVEVRGKLFCFALPLDHPQSVFRNSWKKALRILKPAFERIPKQVAHNGKFDAKWLRHYGVRAMVTFDTMLAAHLLDENRMKGLKPLARVLLGVAPWGIDTKDLRNTQLYDVLIYNTFDTYYTYQLYKIFRQQLIDQPRLLRIFTKLTIPANDILIDVERRGVWIDREKLATAYKIAFDMRDEIDAKLRAWVPNPEDTESDFHSPVPWPKMGKKGKYAEVNFNASNFLRWWLFDHLQLPVIARGKKKDDGSPGDPSVAEDVMIELRDHHSHPVVDLLMERSKWQKYCSTYVSRYREIVDDNSRIHTTFKLAGTVTGRLSSGKEDEEKITATRDRGRGVNLQQVPRDPFIRGLFGAAPGWSFVEADLAQIEFRLAAFISRDPTALRLIQMGVDVHMAMAMRMTGKPEHAVTKEERKAAKPVNFGYLYGMWWTKFMQTAKVNYGIEFTPEEAQASRAAFFDMYPGFLAWHARQRRLVHQFARVQSPLGRVRNLPDIRSADKKVVQEAERQAINSPVQSLASDMNVLAMILIKQQFDHLGLEGYTLGLVHDAINFEIRNDHLHDCLPIIKDTMEHLPLAQKFGVNLDIPIGVDIKVGSHWGHAREVESDHIYNFNPVKELYVSQR